MNGKTGSRRGARRAGALAVLAAVAMLATGCNYVHVSFGSGSAGSGTYQANLAFAHCMQTHGLPSFPDPRPGQGFSVGSRATGNSPMARAHRACKHLL